MKPEEALFADALALPPTEREAFLARACATDAALRQRVEILLRGHDGAGALLEKAALAEAGDLTTSSDDRTRKEYATGMRIGRYNLLQTLGEGGCGVVFMAEQEEPVRRRVALKIIKLGMDTREVIARFEAERQALALMDHPNIAHVLDAGATESGRPFFVMELVRGTPITRYCDERGVSTSERLQLFIQVCHAVQHAHQKGIIHRDLKPTNILVTKHDGVAVPKVIDFGIAKATQGRLTDKTLFTAFEQFIGTPAYMSPEQADWSALDVDSRSDIYSLGVLLYELLTGRTPFESQELACAGLEEMRRIIREEEPPKPSTRVGTIDSATRATIAKQRGTEPAKLSALLRGDLDWIVMRCLEKDRTRRYETANGLAMDLRRHLRCEPVIARPPSTAYVLQRMIRRNKVAFAAAGAIVASLVIGLVFTLAALRREHAARRHADQAAARSTQVANLLKDLLEGAGPRASLGRDTELLREILNDFVIRMPVDLKEQPEVEAELREVLGDVFREIGENATALLMHERALELRRTLFGAQHPAVAASLHEIGVVLERRGSLLEAEKRFREALAIREKLLGSEDAVTAASRAALAHVRLMQGKTPADRGPQGRVSEPGHGTEGAASESGVALSFISDRPQADKPTQIRIGLMGDSFDGKPRTSGLLKTVFLQRALEEEFNDEGISVKWDYYPNTPLNDAHAGGLVDFSNMGPVNALAARANRVDYKLIMGLGQYDSHLCLVARSASPFHTLADLNGKRVGTSKGSNFLYLTFRRILDRHGFVEEDFQVVNLWGASLHAALFAGEIDGQIVVMDNPFWKEQQREVRVIYDPNPRLEPEFASFAKLSVSGEFERRFPTVVQRVVTTLVKAAAWISDEGNRNAVLESWAISPEHHAALERRYRGTTLKERMSPLMDEFFLARLRDECDDAKRFGILAAEADMSFEGWVELKYMNHALTELGLGGFWPGLDGDGQSDREPLRSGSNR